MNPKGFEREIKTFNSQRSETDVLSRLETSFLEKFFKYNINDYFPNYLTNLHEDILDKKAQNKRERVLA